jgi:hypothetical protein
MIQAQLNVPAIHQGDVESNIEYRLSTQGGPVLSSPFLPDAPLTECQLENTRTVSRSNCQPGDARDSIDAQVLCLVVVGYKGRRWSSFPNGAHPEEGH